MRVVSVGPAPARPDRLVARIVPHIRPERVFRIKGQREGRERCPAVRHLVLEIDLDAIAHVHMKGQRTRHQS